MEAAGPQAGQLMLRVVVLAAALLCSRPAGGAAAHDVHVSHTRLVVEGADVVARIRFFRDDLEKALGRHLAPDAATRAALAAYLRPRLLLRADGAALPLSLVEQGSEDDASGQPVWWAVVQGRAARPVRALGLRVLPLFETFRDQQNLVVVLHPPAEARQALYFQAGDQQEQVVRFE